jgi:hypothetical protein
MSNTIGEDGRGKNIGIADIRTVEITEEMREETTGEMKERITEEMREETTGEMKEGITEEMKEETDGDGKNKFYALISMD